MLMMEDNKLHKWLAKQLATPDKLVFENPELYLYIQNTSKNKIPVLLVAHLDTVHKGKPELVCYDSEQEILWSPSGLGADDRAGVYAAMQLSKQFNVDVLFTHGEESGGKGASAFIRDYPSNLARYKMLIQLDRRGSHDAVFYCNRAEDFHAYITDAGFVKAYGSFSDISIIAPVWRVNAVNLSIGFISEHTLYEHLKLAWMRNTMVKLVNLFAEPIPSFEYKEADYKTYYSNDRKYTASDWDDIDDICGHCTKVAKAYSDYEIVYIGDKTIPEVICEECWKKFKGYYCIECGEPVFPEWEDNLSLPDLHVCSLCFEHHLSADLFSEDRDNKFDKSKKEQYNGEKRRGKQ